MPTLRNGLNGLWEEADHPQLALEHLAPFSENPEQAKGQKQKHQSDVITRKGWDPLIREYHRAFKRRDLALNGYRGAFEDGTTQFYTIDFQGRMATGLGNASVMENGLSLNHTYGLPLLSGTGLKGLASAMAHLGLEGESWHMGTPEKDYKDQGSDHKALFGDRNTGEADAAAGIVTFHDAWWDPEPTSGKTAQGLPFELDVVTPHQKSDYILNGTAWPNDWTEPVPSPFLTVKGTFQIPLTGPKEWVDAAYKILAMAFQHLGFGAKTQIGYGRGELGEHLSADEKARKDKEYADQEAERKRLEDEKRKRDIQDEMERSAAAVAAHLASLPQEILRGVLKPMRTGGKLTTRLEAGGVVFSLTQVELEQKAGKEAASALWNRLEGGKEAKVVAVLVMDGNVRRVIKLDLPS